MVTRAWIPYFADRILRTGYADSDPLGASRRSLGPLPIAGAHRLRSCTDSASISSPHRAVRRFGPNIRTEYGRIFSGDRRRTAPTATCTEIRSHLASCHCIWQLLTLSCDSPFDADAQSVDCLHEQLLGVVGPRGGGSSRGPRRGASKFRRPAVVRSISRPYDVVRGGS